MIKRLRPKYSDEELRELYAVPHDHTRWEDHVQRVEATVAFARRNALSGRVTDLSCGSGAIAKALSSEPVLGDFAPHPDYRFTGPIEVTVKLAPFSDVFILTETLEHLDVPLNALRAIRNKTRMLLLSTPVHYGDEFDENPEHYFQWDKDGVEALLTASDFSVVDYEEFFAGFGYRYGMWVCQ